MIIIMCVMKLNGVIMILMILMINDNINILMNE